jgi:hypothetical protein
MTATRINPFRTQLGLFLPNGIAELETIGPAAKLIYGRLLQFAGQKGYCWPAVATIAAAVKISKSSAKTALKELEAEKLIEVEQRTSPDGDNASNYYYFLSHPALHAHPLDGGGSESDPPRLDSDPPRSKSDPKENQIKESIKNSSSRRAAENPAAVFFDKKEELPPAVLLAILNLPPGMQADALDICQNEPTIPETKLAALAWFAEKVKENKAKSCGLLRKAVRTGLRPEEKKPAKQIAERQEKAEKWWAKLKPEEQQFWEKASRCAGLGKQGVVGAYSCFSTEQL